MTNGNEPAYPQDGWGNHEEKVTGLTKREAFAMAAMQGILANQGFDPFGNLTPIGELAVISADAVIAALNQSPNP